MGWGRRERPGLQVDRDESWVAPAFDHPDTLLFNAATSRYTRYDKGRLQVVFDNLGRHIFTVNRLGDTTRFSYDGSGRLQTLRVATPAATNLSYQFAYDPSTGFLQTVTGPGVGASRVVTLTWPAVGTVTPITIRDPDNSIVTYGRLQAGTYWISSRTGKNGVVTAFTFEWAGRLLTATTGMGGGQPSIGMLIQNRDALGNPGGSSVDTSLAHTSVDGPRTDVVDSTAIWLDRHGQPTKVVDALGNPTLIARTDLNWPGLVTRVALPTGRIMRAVYDNRGNPTSLIDSVTPVATKSDTTRYTWDGRFDQVTKIDPPEHDSTLFSVNASNGRREWVEDARGDTSRVTFTYADVAFPGQVTAMTLPLVNNQAAIYQYSYDPTRRNLDAVQSPRGFGTSYSTDAVGRVIRVDTPVDTLTGSIKKMEPAGI